MNKGKIAALAASVLVLASCGTKWERDFDAALGRAQAEDKCVLLNITSFETDSISKPLQKDVFEKWGFGRKYGGRFELVNLDFSELLTLGDPGADATEEQLLDIQRVRDEAAVPMSVAQRYGVRDLPTTLILSKEGFVISRLNFFDVKPDFDPSAEGAAEAKTEDIVDIYGFDRVCKELDDAMPAVDEFVSRVRAADDESADVKSRVDAMNAIFDSTDFAYQRLLRRFSEKVVELDPANSSGSVGKHVVALALSDEMDNPDGVAASASYEKAADNAALGPDDRQFLLFQAATCFSRSQGTPSFDGAGGFDKVASLLEASLSAAPESQFAPAIKSAIEDFGRWRSEYEELMRISAEGGEMPPAAAPADGTAPER